MTYKEEYKELLKSGMFWEFFPEYTGDWNKDGDSFMDFKLQTVGGKTIVVWFSCGAASAVAAKKTVEKYGAFNTIRIVNNPVIDEGEDNPRFLKDCEKWIGVKIESCVNPSFPNASIQEVFEKFRYMSGVGGARCTLELKKNARKNWESENEFDYIVMGFTSEESSRLARFRLTERDNVLNVLGLYDLSKKRCMVKLNEAGIDIPEAYKDGFNNANCKGCVKATSPTYWNLVRLKYPDVFERRAKQSREIGCKLVKYKGKRIFLDELPENAKGRPMKSLVMPDCGIFCEEKTF